MEPKATVKVKAEEIVDKKGNGTSVYGSGLDIAKVIKYAVDQDGKPNQSFLSLEKVPSQQPQREFENTGPCYRWSVTVGLLPLVCYRWSVTVGLLPLVCYRWSVTVSLLPLVCYRWSVTVGLLPLVCYRWSVTVSLLPLVCYRWSVTVGLLPLVCYR